VIPLQRTSKAMREEGEIRVEFRLSYPSKQKKGRLGSEREPPIGSVRKSFTTAEQDSKIPWKGERIEGEEKVLKREKLASRIKQQQEKGGRSPFQGFVERGREKSRGSFPEFRFKQAGRWGKKRGRR